MKLLKIGYLVAILLLLNSCASGYKMISPTNLNYNTNSSNNGVLLQYKYNLLDKKYAKKELKKGIKLVAVKITNNSDKDLIFGSDIKLHYEDGSELNIIENEKVFKSLKQNSATYLLYLLLTPVNFYTYETNASGFQETTSSTPIGLVLGPALTGGNIIAVSTANNKFKTELLDFEILGATIEKGKTLVGIIGVKSAYSNSIKIKVN